MTGSDRCVVLVVGGGLTGTGDLRLLVTDGIGGRIPQGDGVRLGTRLV